MNFYSESTRKAFQAIGFLTDEQSRVESLMGKYISFRIDNFSISRSSLSYEVVDNAVKLEDILNGCVKRYVVHSLVITFKVLNIVESRCLEESRGLNFSEGDRFDKVIPRIMIDTGNLEIAGHTVSVAYLELDPDTNILYLVYDDISELILKTDEYQELRTDTQHLNTDIKTVTGRRLKMDKDRYYLV